MVIGMNKYLQNKEINRLRSERFNEGKLQNFIVRDSVWKMANRKLLHRYATQEEIAENIGRPLQAEDYIFIMLNWWSQDTLHYLGNKEYNRMIQMFKDKMYQIHTYENDYSDSFIKQQRKSFMTYLEEL